MGKVKIAITIVQESRTIIQEISRVLRPQCSCCGGYATGTWCACDGGIWRAGFLGMTCVIAVVASSLDSIRTHSIKIGKYGDGQTHPKTILIKLSSIVSFFSFSSFACALVILHGTISMPWGLSESMQRT
jgi:hypothetical protein